MLAVAFCSSLVFFVSFPPIIAHLSSVHIVFVRKLISCGHRRSLQQIIISLRNKHGDQSCSFTKCISVFHFISINFSSIVYILHPSWKVRSKTRLVVVLGAEPGARWRSSCFPRIFCIFLVFHKIFIVSFDWVPLLLFVECIICFFSSDDVLLHLSIRFSLFSL